MLRNEVFNYAKEHGNQAVEHFLGAPLTDDSYMTIVKTVSVSRVVNTTSKVEMPNGQNLKIGYPLG